MASNDNTSMLASHAQYVKGVAEETIGNWTSSESWTQSGRHDKEEAVAALRASHTEPDTTGRNKTTLESEGKIERAAGWATGCGGMVHDGERKMQASLEQ